LTQHSQPLDLEEALASLNTQLFHITDTQQCPLEESNGRVLATRVVAGLNLPPFRASAMDGYAIYSGDQESELTVIGQSLAGHPYTGDIKPGECLRVFTGSMLPDSAEAVIIQEEVAYQNAAQIRFKSHKPAESFIRPIGNDVELGAEIAQRGELISPFLIGSLASAGVHQVEVYRKPVVGVFSSGDELIDPTVPVDQLKPGQIYDSNRLTVLQLMSQLPVEVIDLGRLADDAKTVSEALTQASQNCDAMITSGGVSVGDADYISETIGRLGDLSFWRLNLKPGKPMAFGQINSCPIFGLPGNPVSTIITALFLVRPALMTLAGSKAAPELRIEARLETNVRHQKGRTEYQRGTYSISSNGFSVSNTGDQGSNRLSTFHNANCLIEIDKYSGDLSVGDRVNILPLANLLSC
jgi:molybdopterin molybdotransferase